MSDTANVANELEKLDELRTRGVISADDFDRRKAALLGPPRKVKQKRPGTFLAMSVILLSIALGTAYGDGGISIIVFMLGFLLYLLPAFVAYERAHTNRHAILLVNLFLGWSVIGWIGALIWSATSAKAHA